MLTDDSQQLNIILFPDFAELKKTVEKLRTELSMLVLEHDELLYVECKNIEMAYMLHIGGLEYKAYEIECAILRMKRKVELIQAKKNRQEKVVLSEIEQQLDDEFAEYVRTLQEQLDRMNSALARKQGTVLSAAETREIKKLYRAIIKSLHPDLNPDLSDAELKLFHNAVAAYENGDLDSLRAIEAMISNPVLPEDESQAIAQLVKEKERLQQSIESVKERIAQMKAEFPYTMKALLQNSEEIEMRQQELHALIEQLQETLAFYKAKLEEMLG